jgi:DNA repair protein RadD
MELRVYQLEILQKLREGFLLGHRAQILYLPTGGGKTEVAIALMDATSKKFKRAAMVLDRIVLCDQPARGAAGRDRSADGW